MVVDSEIQNNAESDQSSSTCFPLFLCYYMTKYALHETLAHCAKQDIQVIIVLMISWELHERNQNG